MVSGFVYYVLEKRGARTQLGISTFMHILLFLHKNHKTLERRNVISRKVIENRPPRVEYSLTKKGKNIAKILYELDECLQE